MVGTAGPQGHRPPRHSAGRSQVGHGKSRLEEGTAGGAQSGIAAPPIAAAALTLPGWPPARSRAMLLMWLMYCPNLAWYRRAVSCTSLCSADSCASSDFSLLLQRRASLFSSGPGSGAPPPRSALGCPDERPGESRARPRGSAGPGGPKRHAARWAGSSRSRTVRPQPRGL